MSEGEIRAFRDGQSMKFRKEDVEAIASQRSGDDELVLADALEDDTGKVTEELSDEDTLLVEDDMEEVDEESPARISTRSRREQLTTKKEGEPGWVTAAAILGLIALLWGALLSWDIAHEAKPGDSIASMPWKADAKKGTSK